MRLTSDHMQQSAVRNLINLQLLLLRLQTAARDWDIDTMRQIAAQMEDEANALKSWVQLDQIIREQVKEAKREV